VFRNCEENEKKSKRNRKEIEKVLKRACKCFGNIQIIMM